MCQKNIYRAINLFINTGSSDLKPSFKPKSNTGLVNKVKAKFVKSSSISESQLAASLKINQSTVNRIKKKLGIVSRRKQKKPRYVKDQIKKEPRLVQDIFTS